MTTDTLGPCAPMYHRTSLDDDRPLVTSAYADWQRRRAEQAEALLRKGMRWRDHDPKCSDHPGNRCLCGLWDHEARVAAHFESVKGEKP